MGSASCTTRTIIVMKANDLCGGGVGWGYCLIYNHGKPRRYQSVGKFIYQIIHDYFLIGVTKHSRCDMYDRYQNQCWIEISHRSRSPITFIFIDESSWHFAQGTVSIMPCIIWEGQNYGQTRFCDMSVWDVFQTDYIYTMYSVSWVY